MNELKQIDAAEVMTDALLSLSIGESVLITGRKASSVRNTAWNTGSRWSRRFTVQELNDGMLVRRLNDEPGKLALRTVWTE